MRYFEVFPRDGLSTRVVVRMICLPRSPYSPNPKEHSTLHFAVWADIPLGCVLMVITVRDSSQ